MMSYFYSAMVHKLQIGILWIIFVVALRGFENYLIVKQVTRYFEGDETMIWSQRGAACRRWLSASEGEKKEWFNGKKKLDNVV